MATYKKVTPSTKSINEEKARLKSTLLQKIKAKYAKSLESSGKHCMSSIETEIDQFVSKSALTQENLVALDEKVRRIIEKSQENVNKVATPAVSGKMTESKRSQESSKGVSGKEQMEKKGVWGAVATYNRILYDKEEKEKSEYKANMKKSTKYDLDKQIAEKKRLKAEQQKKERETEARELQKQMSNEQQQITNERNQRMQVSNVMRTSCKLFEGNFLLCQFSSYYCSLSEEILSKIIRDFSHKNRNQKITS